MIDLGTVGVLDILANFETNRIRKYMAMGLLACT
jgi:hypothetical protein